MSLEQNKSKIETGVLSASQLALAINGFTGGDPRAQEALSAALSGARPLAGFPMGGDLAFRSLDLLAESLRQAEQIVEVDWAVGYEDAALALKTLFSRRNIQWSDDIAKRLDACAPRMQRGDGVGFVYVLITEHARAAGFEILCLDNGGDQYWFFLAPIDVAGRWRNVSIGEGVYIESPEWQFTEQFKDLGIIQRYLEHPSDAVKRPPSAS